MWMWSTGINRNIVECKANQGRTLQASGSSINRNIVECKGSMDEVPPEGRTIVLIETLWNVKLLKGILEPVIGEQY